MVSPAYHEVRLKEAAQRQLLRLRLDAVGVCDRGGQLHTIADRSRLYAEHHGVGHVLVEDQRNPRRIRHNAPGRIHQQRRQRAKPQGLGDAGAGLIHAGDGRRCIDLLGGRVEGLEHVGGGPVADGSALQ